MSKGFVQPLFPVSQASIWWLSVQLALAFEMFINTDWRVNKWTDCNLIIFPLAKDQALVRRGSQGVVSLTCDPVLALGQRFYSNSRCLFCCNPLR